MPPVEEKTAITKAPVAPILPPPSIVKPRVLSRYRKVVAPEIGITETIEPAAVSDEPDLTVPPPASSLAPKSPSSPQISRPVQLVSPVAEPAAPPIAPNIAAQTPLANTSSKEVISQAPRMLDNQVH